MSPTPRGEIRIPWWVALLISVGAHVTLGSALLAASSGTDQSKHAAMEMSQRKLELPPLKKKKLPPKPKPKAPETKKIETEVKKTKRVVRRRPSKAPPKVLPPIAEKMRPPTKAPPSDDTGPKTFGIKMEGKSTAPAGTGVAVPKGDSLEVSPRIRRRGKATKGFKKTFSAGEQAPLAVITTRPLPVKRVQPDYPERMRNLGIEGRVVLQLTVDGKGRVTKAKIIKSLHPDLDRLCVAAAKKMIFKPATVNGTPVLVKIPYSFAFVLD